MHVTTAAGTKRVQLQLDNCNDDSVRILYSNSLFYKISNYIYSAYPDSDLNNPLLIFFRQRQLRIVLSNVCR